MKFIKNIALIMYIVIASINPKILPLHLIMLPFFAHFCELESYQDPPPPPPDPPPEEPPPDEPPELLDGLELIAF